MRYKIASLAAAAIVFGGVQMASAADMAVKAPIMRGPVAVAYNWTGCYIGIAGGANWGRSRQDNSAGTITGDFNVSGGIVGGTLGCNYQFDRTWLIGLETDFSWTNKRGSVTDLPPFSPAFSSETRERWLGTVRGRLGATFGAMNSELLYVTGGLAYARVEINVSSAAISASESKTRAGWTVGGGWEHKFSQNLSGKLEYLFVDLGNTAYFNPPPAGFADRAGGVKLTDHIVRVGLNWQFWP